MKAVFGAACLVMGLATSAGTASWADTIDFSQFGGEGTQVADGSTGLTVGGVSFAISGGHGLLTLFTQGSLWTGTFAPGAAVLCNCGGPGEISITFGAPLAAFEIGAQTNDNGPYVATLTAYDAGHSLLGSVSVNGVSANSPSTIPVLSVTEAGIVSVTIGSTDDGDGFAVAAAPGAGGGPAVPEPATWALMLVGFGLAGLPLRRRRGRLS